VLPELKVNGDRKVLKVHKELKVPLEAKDQEDLKAHKVLKALLALKVFKDQEDRKEMLV
jgi:hypothetical protein